MFNDDRKKANSQTGSTQKINLVRLAAGMNGHVTKPIDPDQLFAALQKWIRPARMQNRVASEDASTAATVAGG